METCLLCSAPFSQEDRFCRACGASLIELGPMGLDWVWVIYGTVLITTFQFVLLAVASLSFLGEELALALANPSEGLWGKIALHTALLLGTGYLVGGILVGRMSAGHTILEPALAAGLPAAVLLGYSIIRMSGELLGSGVLWEVIGLSSLVVVACFLVALLGGALGERWQDLTQIRHSNPPFSSAPQASALTPPSPAQRQDVPEQK